ncbi:MAG: alpha-amylase family glycosyl hydrolase [Pseudobacter sp.]|uniref:alpha-amylase family glycosyl hydrolase n=1 Tax=Pseudobacter sp. TaxID=2045420 RepID=UPI003F7E2386
MNTYRILVIALVSVLLLGSCKKDDKYWSDLPNSEVTPISANNKVIYEVNLYHYSSQRNINGLKNDLARLKELGVDIVWLMPVHPIGIINRSGTVGSPYSIRDYKAINPDYGTKDDFKALITAAHGMGMEIWMDWVANHTAWDNAWVTDHLDYYSERNGERPYSPNGWPDVVQLDYNNTAMRAAMIDAMKYWVEEFDIDGYRCDAAALVPLSFWKEARQQVDAIKKITWMCEADDPTYMEVFDYDYAWLFSNALNNFGNNNDVPQLVAACKQLFNNVNYKNKGRMVFLTNHDMNAFEGTEFDRLGNNVLPLTALTFTIYDMPLIYNAQEIGLNKRLDFSSLTDIPWQQTNKLYLNLFKKLTQLKRTQPALESGTGRGELKIYRTNQPKVFCYSRKKGENEVLVILNLGDMPVRLQFDGELPSGQFKDYLNNTYHGFTAGDAIYMQKNGYAIYVK